MLNAGIEDIGSGNICDSVKYGYEEAYSKEKKENKSIFISKLN